MSQMIPILALLLLLSGPAATAQTGDAVRYVATYIDVQSGSTDQGIALIRQYRETSRVERGNSTVDVLQEIARPNRFVIVEVWKDQSSFETHERAEQTVQFRAKLKVIDNSPLDQRVHHAFAMDSRSVAMEAGFVSVVTHVDVPPQRKDETEVMLTGLAQYSRKDEGNVRYEVFQQTASRNHFTVFAIWKNRKAFDSYEMKTHTRQFREALAPMLGAPYDERLYSPLI